MNPLVVFGICFVVMLVLMFLRFPIFIALTVSSFLGVWYLQGMQGALAALGTIPFATMNAYIWTAIPLYVLLGYLALHSGMAEDFYVGVRKWVGFMRGGLCSAIILANTAFGACTGDMIGACVTFTSVSLPETRKVGYADSLTLGSIAAGTMLAPLIPPSVTFILYGALTGTSIGKMFLAGILPGILLTVLYIGVIYGLCRHNPTLGPPGPKTTFREKLGAGLGMWSLIIIFGTIIGGLFIGLFTPTEAGAVGLVIVLIIALARRRLSWKGFTTALYDGGLTIGVVAFLLIGSMIFNLILVLTGAPAWLAEAMGGITQSPIGTLLIIVVVVLILGCFIDALSMLLILTPILYTIILNVGIDPIHFGVVFGVATITGTLTPPFGVVIYAMSGVAKDVPLFTIFRAVFPFIAAIVVLLIVLVFFPQISTFLPSLMKQ